MACWKRIVRTGAQLQVRVVEKFCDGKYCDDRNEDRLFESANHIAVIDGSSAAQPIRGRPGGVVAAETVVDVLRELSADATIDTFERSASEALARMATEHAVASPYAAAVVLSLQRREIWRIGDCPFAIDGVWNIPEHNPHERSYFSFRQMMASGYRRNSDFALSESEAAARIADVTRDWLAMTKGWVNADKDDVFAFAALDERPAPAHFKEVFRLPDAVSDIVLASDGAVVSRNGQQGPGSVADMLERIETVRTHDPNCLALFPYWRGFLDGARFLDDTTFIALSVEG